MRWQGMKDDKKKYAAYLCSREWAVLKEAVKRRSGGVCERCMVNPMDHVHHLTYERKYAEELDDLQACCKQCHEFIHAKSDVDPADDRPIVLPWHGEIIKSFYLAGKITGTTWRSSIIPDWSFENHSSTYYQAYFDYEESKTWSVVPNACTVSGVNLHYTGPWWKDTGGGHGCSDDSRHPHGFSLDYDKPDHNEVAARQVEVSNAVRRAIQAADLVFAWIDSKDCYGTILEIGFARALGKCVVVAMSQDFADTRAAREMWLATKWGYYIDEKTPELAWRLFWKLVEVEQEEAKDGAHAR